VLQYQRKFGTEGARIQNKAIPTWLQEQKNREQYIELTFNDVQNLQLCYPQNLILSNPNLEFVMKKSASSLFRGVQSFFGKGQIQETRKGPGHTLKEVH